MLAHRREFLQAAAGGLVAATLPRGASLAADEKMPAPIGFGFSLYGMKTLPLEHALNVCRKIGYDSVEWSALADWPGDPAKLTAADRKQYRQQLADLKLTLAAVMENLPLLADDAKHKANLERLKAACDLARDLSPERPAVVETVLGGKPAEWNDLKGKFVERLKTWAEVAAAAKVVLAIKAHVANSLHTPADAAWLVQQVGSPWLKLAYDYSHFGLHKLTIADTWSAMAADTVFVHIKDYTGEPSKFRFLLPGEGQTDYAELLRQLAARKYAGQVVVEVSGQVFNQPGYDPIAAAETTYAKVAPAWKAAGVPRPA